MMDFAGAQRCFEQILGLPKRPCFVGVDPGLATHLTRHQLAVAHRQQGHYAAAEAEWRLVIEGCPGFAPAWVGVAEVRLAQNRIAEVEDMVAKLGTEGHIAQRWWNS